MSFKECLNPAHPFIDTAAHERQVIVALAGGKSADAIAAALRLSPHTVRSQSVYEKLGASSVVKAMNKLAWVRVVELAVASSLFGELSSNSAPQRAASPAHRSAGSRSAAQRPRQSRRAALA